MSRLVIQDVSSVYGDAIAALHGVSVTVGSGEIVALIGSNGAGKTTTLKAATHLLPAERGRITAGAIHFKGHDVLRTTPDRLVRLGLAQVLEGRHCFRSLTVEENLVTGAIARGTPRREIGGDLEQVYSLFPRLRVKRGIAAGLTSGGEQQMAAIGRALMSRPKLLVLDEPSMGLAPKIVKDIFEALRWLNESEGLSILVAEQNSAIALRYAHSAVLLENGLSVLHGSASELRKRPDIKTFYLGDRTNSEAATFVAGRAP